MEIWDAYMELSATRSSHIKMVNKMNLKLKDMHMCKDYIEITSV